MRHLLSLSALLLFTSFAHAHETVPVSITKAFIPIGFDDNDVSQVVIAGTLPNTCYKLGPTTYSVDSASRSIAVRQMAYHYPGVACLEVLIPYTQVVNIGILREGNYRIVDGTGGALLGQLPVKRATTPGQDEYLYAPVSEAHVQSQASPRKHTLVLTGMFSDRCTTLREVRITYHPQVVVVQPIADRHEPADDARPCIHRPTRFSHSVDLDPSLTGGQLLHVRVMNGQALNQIVDFP